MPSLSDIASDPAWLPHHVDMQARRVAFLRIDPQSYAQPGFLADRQPASPDEAASVGFDELAGLKIETGPLHFIFHTAFCRSTLLARALNIPGASFGLSEPGIFASLTNAGPAGAQWIAPMMQLMARAHQGHEVVFAKPTNHSNRLIPALLHAAPDARAVLMTNPLDSFLRSVARKGMMGRRWGRQLFLEMQSYAGIDFGMDPRETFAMSDMQAAGLAWLLNQNYFAALLAGRDGSRLRVLDGDAFNAERARTIAATLDFVGHPIQPEQSEAAATAPVFSSHSKRGGTFDAAEDAASDPRLSEEIGQVGEWVNLIAGQLPHPIPLKQTLF